MVPNAVTQKKLFEMRDHFKKIGKRREVEPLCDGTIRGELVGRTLELSVKPLFSQMAAGEANGNLNETVKLGRLAVG
jgi:hypothetical protein